MPLAPKQGAALVLHHLPAQRALPEKEEREAINKNAMVVKDSVSAVGGTVTFLNAGERFSTIPYDALIDLGDRGCVGSWEPVPVAALHSEQ